MKPFAIAAVVTLLLPLAAQAQDAVRPCKASRQASGAQVGDPAVDGQQAGQPAAQSANGGPATDPTPGGQIANSAACEAAPPDTR